MAQITLDIPNGTVATRVGQIALSWWDTTHANDNPKPARPAALGAVKEMLLAYTRSVYQQAAANDAAAAAQATIATAATQAATDANTIA